MIEVRSTPTTAFGPLEWVAEAWYGDRRVCVAFRETREEAERECRWRAQVLLETPKEREMVRG
jgi:hypothetical protein